MPALDQGQEAACSPSIRKDVSCTASSPPTDVRGSRRRSSRRAGTLFGLFPFLGTIVRRQCLSEGPPVTAPWPASLAGTSETEMASDPIVNLRPPAGRALGAANATMPAMPNSAAGWPRTGRTSTATRSASVKDASHRRASLRKLCRILHKVSLGHRRPGTLSTRAYDASTTYNAWMLDGRIQPFNPRTYRLRKGKPPVTSSRSADTSGQWFAERPSPLIPALPAISVPTFPQGAHYRLLPQQR